MEDYTSTKLNWILEMDKFEKIEEFRTESSSKLIFDSIRNK